MMHLRFALLVGITWTISALFAGPSIAGAQKPPTGALKVFILAGQSNMEGQGVVDLDHELYYNSGKGNLEHVMRDPAKAPRYRHLRNPDGTWVERDDVSVWYRTGHDVLKKGKLTVGYTPYPEKHHMGPELQFGHIMGDLFDEQVLLIKTAWGGKSLYKDFRPPSAGGEVGPYYTKMLAEVREVLGDIGAHFPEYEGKGYELRGIVWFQGWNDMCTKEAVPQYEENLVHLIKDVRRDLKTPNLPVVVGELGNGGPDASGSMLAIRQAQKAATLRPEFAGNVLFVETSAFARPADQSPCQGHGHHWFANAESYFLIGDALGEGMKTLLRK